MPPWWTLFTCGFPENRLSRVPGGLCGQGHRRIRSGGANHPRAVAPRPRRTPPGARCTIPRPAVVGGPPAVRPGEGFRVGVGHQHPVLLAAAECLFLGRPVPPRDYGERHAHPGRRPRCRRSDARPSERSIAPSARQPRRFASPSRATGRSGRDQGGRPPDRWEGAPPHAGGGGRRPSTRGPVTNRRWPGPAPDGQGPPIGIRSEGAHDRRRHHQDRARPRGRHRPRRTPTLEAASARPAPNRSRSVPARERRSRPGRRRGRAPMAARSDTTPISALYNLQHN